MPFIRRSLDVRSRTLRRRGALGRPWERGTDHARTVTAVAARRFGDRVRADRLARGSALSRRRAPARVEIAAVAERRRRAQRRASAVKELATPASPKNAPRAQEQSAAAARERQAAASAARRAAAAEAELSDRRRFGRLTSRQKPERIEVPVRVAVSLIPR